MDNVTISYWVFSHNVLEKIHKEFMKKEGYVGTIKDLFNDIIDGVVQKEFIMHGHTIADKLIQESLVDFLNKNPNCKNDTVNYILSQIVVNQVKSIMENEGMYNSFLREKVVVLYRNKIDADMIYYPTNKVDCLIADVLKNNIFFNDFVSDLMELFIKNQPKKILTIEVPVGLDKQKVETLLNNLLNKCGYC